MIERSQLFAGGRALAFVVTAGLAVAACNGDPEIDLADVTTTSESTTTSTTEPTTTSTTEPTSTTLDDEAAVRELHTYFMTEYFAFKGKDVTAAERIDLLKTFADGPIVQRTIEVRTEDEALGYYSAGGAYDSNIVSVEIDGDRALVVDCSQGLGELYNAEDELLIAADDFFKLRTSELVKIDGKWWIYDLYSGGDERCDPDD